MDHHATNLEGQLTGFRSRYFQLHGSPISYGFSKEMSPPSKLPSVGSDPIFDSNPVMLVVHRH